MASMLAVPETISSSQARPRAMDLISAVRRSAFIGRARDLAVEAGRRISLNLLAGGFVHGINSAEFSSIGAGGAALSSAPSALGCISQSAKWLLRTSMRATFARRSDSAFIGRGRDLAVEAGSRISLNLLAGGFVQGINSAEFSSTGAGGPVLSSAPSALGCISQTAKWLLRT